MWYLDLTNHQRSALMEHAPGINDLLVKLERKMEGRSVADPPHPNDFNRTRRAVVDAARPFADKPALSDTEKVAFDALVEVTDSLGNAADKAARQRELNDEAAAAFGRPVDGRGSVTGWVDANGRPVAVLAPEDRLSSADGGDFRDLHIGSLMRAMAGAGTRNDLAIRALQEGLDSAGGVTVPEHLVRQFIDLMRARTRVIQAGARTVPLSTEKTSIARITSDPTAAWRAELGAVAQSEPTFDKVEFVARSLAVKLPVSLELLQDSLNIEDALRTALAGAFAVEMDRVALFGSGTAPEPEGVANVTGVNEVSMGTDGAALSGYGELLQAFQAIADANAPEPTACLMAPRTKFAFAGLTATDGQPLMAPKVINDVPFMDSTNLPVDESHGTATNASRIITGDFKQLLIGVRQGLRIEVLRHTLADDLTITFVAHLRADVALVHPAAFAMVTGIVPA